MDILLNGNPYLEGYNFDESCYNSTSNMVNSMVNSWVTSGAAHIITHSTHSSADSYYYILTVL